MTFSDEEFERVLNPPLDEQIASIAPAISRLRRALLLTQLALNTAGQAPNYLQEEHPSPTATQVLENWDVANELVNLAFRSLSFQVLDATTLMRDVAALLSQRPDAR
jgi:hypothetical protein